jgi:RimJ/RimL family protein N-acetyltransferase
MTVGDVPRLYEIYSEPSITMYTEPLFEDINEETEYTRAYIKNQYGFFGFGLWIIEEKPLPGTEKELSVNAAEEKDGDNERSGGRVVGRAGISLREGYDEAELGYVIEKDRQNRGYATEACEAIVGYAANVLGMSGLNCFVRPENTASVRLCARLGFEYLEEAYINGRRFDRYHLDLSAS